MDSDLRDPHVRIVDFVVQCGLPKSTLVGSTLLQGALGNEGSIFQSARYRHGKLMHCLTALFASGYPSLSG